MVVRTVAPNNAHILTPETCECIKLHGKKNFADVINGEITLDYPVGPLLEGGLESERSRDWKMLPAFPKLGDGP